LRRSSSSWPARWRCCSIARSCFHWTGARSVSSALSISGASWRQLIARLPFIANKDVVFAAAAVFLIGRDHEIGEMLTFIAALIVAAHVIVGIVLVVEYIIRKDAA